MDPDSRGDEVTCLACSVRSISKWADGLYITRHKSPTHNSSDCRPCRLSVPENLYNPMPKSPDYDDQVLHELGHGNSMFKEPEGLKSLGLLFLGT